MKNEKLEELASIEREFKRKITERKRMHAMGKMVSKIISTIAKHLIKDVGYSVATTILKRECRDIGKDDAEEFIDTFSLKENDPENASKALKIAAMFLGLKLGVKGSETIVRECPLGEESIKFKEPILCNICLEYNNGVLQRMLGDGYVLDRVKWVFKGDGYCAFKARKRLGY